MQEIPVKAWWQSKVLWFNVALFLAEVVAQLLPELQARIAGGSALWLLGLGAAANVFLRLFGTAQPATVTAALKVPTAYRTVVVDHSRGIYSVYRQDSTDLFRAADAVAPRAQVPRPGGTPTALT